MPIYQVIIANIGEFVGTSEEELDPEDKGIMLEDVARVLKFKKTPTSEIEFKFLMFDKDPDYKPNGQMAVWFGSSLFIHELQPTGGYAKGYIEAKSGIITDSRSLNRHDRRAMAAQVKH